MKSFEEMFALCEFVDFRNVQEFFGILQKYVYRVVGGVAVAYYVRTRIPSKGDLDVLVDNADLVDILYEFEEAGWIIHREGFRDKFEYILIEKGGDEFDILVDGKILESSGYKLASLRGLNIKVIDPENLIALKFLAGRDKDIQDIGLILKAGVCDRRRLEKVLKRVVGEDAIEELEVLQYIAENPAGYSSKRWFEEKARRV